jgi:hypothetical protein
VTGNFRTSTRNLSDGRGELLAEHRACYESPAHEPGVIRLDTSGEAEDAVERVTTAIDST